MRLTTETSGRRRNVIEVEGAVWYDTGWSTVEIDVAQTRVRENAG